MKSFFQKKWRIEISFLNYENKEVPNLVKELHSLMEEKAVGNWKEFKLTLDESGKAHTKFIYD